MDPISAVLIVVIAGMSWRFYDTRHRIHNYPAPDGHAVLYHFCGHEMAYWHPGGKSDGGGRAYYPPGYYTEEDPAQGEMVWSLADEHSELVGALTA